MVSHSKPSGWLTDEELSEARRTVPIFCADAVLMSPTTDPKLVGLIRRVSPFDSAAKWCQIGGRVRVGETIDDALNRHVDEALNLDDCTVDRSPKPPVIMQWFRPTEHQDATRYGLDPRQHAVAVTYVLNVVGEPKARAGSEALEFAWFPGDALPDDTWPGTELLVQKLLRSEGVQL